MIDAIIELRAELRALRVRVEELEARNAQYDADAADARQKFEATIARLKGSVDDSSP